MQLLKPVHPRAHIPQQEKPLQRESLLTNYTVAMAHGSLQVEESSRSNEDPAQPIKK